MLLHARSAFWPQPSSQAAGPRILGTTHASNEERQLQIDSEECTVIAMRTVPLEQRQNYPILSSSVQAQSYAISRTTTTYDANGNIYAGQYYGTAISKSSSSGFTDAYARRAASAQMAQDDWGRNQAYKARDNLAEACMMQRGWEKRPPN
jgi:hypothetical protein